MSMRSAQGGFTMVEVLVALVVLGIGITALVGTSALVTRQVGRGRIVTIANAMANRKLDDLRRAAAIKNGAGNRCADPAFTNGSAGPTRGVAYNWTVVPAGSKAYTVTINASYAVSGGTKTFSISTVVGCY